MKTPDVLVLNRNYVPIHIIDWKKAMSLIFQESARAMDRDYVSYPTYNEWITFSMGNFTLYPIIKTVSKVICVPEIIILTQYDRLPSRDVKYSRTTLFARDGFHCAYCNQVFDKRELTVDHIMPKSRGGKTIWDNTISACKKCNSYKGDKTPQEAGMKLHFKPRKPKWLSPIANLPKEHPCKSWKMFLNRVLVDIGE